MSRAEGAAWHAKQEESSNPQHFEHGRLERQNLSREWFARREQIEVHARPSHCNLSERLGHGGDQRLGAVSKHPYMPSVLEVEPISPIVLRIGNSSEKVSLPTFSTPFNREILEAPRLKQG